VAKRIKNPIEVKATLVFEEGMPTYHIDDVSVHYGVSCEHEIEVRRGMLLNQNTDIENIVKDFIEEAIKQVDAREGIAPEDSLLYVEP
jgi:hypothetical protein